MWAFFIQSGTRSSIWRLIVATRIRTCGSPNLSSRQRDQESYQLKGKENRRGRAKGGWRRQANSTLQCHGGNPTAVGPRPPSRRQGSPRRLEMFVVKTASPLGGSNCLRTGHGDRDMFIYHPFHSIFNTLGELLEADTRWGLRMRLFETRGGQLAATHAAAPCDLQHGG